MRAPIGEMREPVAILTPSTKTDESGGEVITYVEGDRFFAAIRPLGSRESSEYGQVNALISHVMFTHYYQVNAVVADMRLRNLETLEEYDIIGPPMHSPKRDHSKMTLVRRENG